MRAIWLLVPLLSGCARHAVVEATARGEAHLSARSTVVMQITPLGPPPARTVTPDRSRPLALWLPGGSYSVAFFCGMVVAGDKLVSITVDEQGTRQTIDVAAGRHYRLSCANDATGALRVEELGAAPHS